MVAVVVLLAGCGGGGDNGPKLQAKDAAALRSLAHRIGHEGPCAQAKDIPRLRARTNALVNARRVPAALQEPLSSGVAALEEQTPLCVRPVPASPPTPATVPVTPPAHTTSAPRPKPHHGEHGKHGKHGHEK